VADRWRRLGGIACELLGLALIAFVLWKAWWPLPLALLGGLLIWIPNRPTRS